MKYVVIVTDDGRDEMYLFPSSVYHDEFVERLGIDQQNVITAGFVNQKMECHGTSTSLGVESDPEYDTGLLKHLLK